MKHVLKMTHTCISESNTQVNNTGTCHKGKERTVTVYVIRTQWQRQIRCLTKPYFSVVLDVVNIRGVFTAFMTTQ